MPFGFLKREGLTQHAQHLSLRSDIPALRLEGLACGIDNIRYDVALSSRFLEIARKHVTRVIAAHGRVESLIEDNSVRSGVPAWAVRPGDSQFPGSKPGESGEFKRTVTELLSAALNRSKAENNIYIDLLCRLAMIKLFRAEFMAQFAQLQERCRAKLNRHQGSSAPLVAGSKDSRDRYAEFQANKKTILRKAGQDIFSTLRDIEKETLARMRRSLFGDLEAASYDLLLNRLLFVEDGHDDLLNAEQYLMLGNYETDADRFEALETIACEFLRATVVSEDQDEVENLLNVPENAHELFNSGDFSTTSETGEKRKAQRALLERWTDLLEEREVLECIIASYEVVPLLPQYSPTVNPQQLKNALRSNSERARVEKLIEHAKISSEALHAAYKRIPRLKRAERCKLAARFFADFSRYHRDQRRFAIVTAITDSINLLTSERLQELSRVNNTLYEFLLADEQRSAEDRVTSHVIVKADIRDSTTLTRTLSERGLNPASYFSLNFYDPIAKLLPKYGASTVFIEGDALILSLFERPGETLAVARACVLAREMVAIVGAYNQRSKEQGLPGLELGIGIAYQDSAPMYLMYGSHRIMISKALNESDRLSSCHKQARKVIAGNRTPFRVFSLQRTAENGAGETQEDELVRYNVGGVLLSEAAAQKLGQEISLREHSLNVRGLWSDEPMRFLGGMVPVAAGVFHRLVLRESRIPVVDLTGKVTRWTERRYCEVCVEDSIYERVEKPTAQAAAQGK